MIQTASCFAVSFATSNRIINVQPDSLSDYTGKYQTQQGMQTIYANVYVVNGKLTAKSSAGDVLTLDHLSGDNFIISTQGVAVKFLRDAANKVSEIAINGNVAWIRVGDKLQTDSNLRPPVPSDYLGKYKVTLNGQSAVIEISLKNGLLWATQLWDGGNSPLKYTSGDEFIVVALKMSLKFVRDKDKHVFQMLLNNTDLFTKI